MAAPSQAGVSSPAGAATQGLLLAVLAHRSRRAWSEADAALQTALGAATADAAASAAVGDLASTLGDYRTALAAYDRAIALRPGQAAFWFNRAAVRRFLGQLDESETDYDQCIALDPADAQAYLNRSSLRTQTPARNHVEQIERRLALGGVSWVAEVALRYALAKEYEDLERYAASWNQLAAGAALRRQHLQYDLAHDLATVDWLIEAFPAGRTRVPGDPSPEPIFILGMPRTGSTLVDRMLGTHTRVTSAGELVDFGNAVVHAARGALAIPSGGRAPTRRELIGASARVDFQALGADYLARTRPLTGRSARFTDKLPLNYLYCALIDAALPWSKIVHVTRHPMATCYGVFKVLFDQGYPYSYDLTEIADYYIGYRRLMAHWHAALPGRIIEVAYEQLVADPAGQCRQLLDRLELPWEAECLEFHRNPAPTATASAAQVRRPIYTSALVLWQHYAAQLDPLRKRLEAAGIDCAKFGR